MTFIARRCSIVIAATILICAAVSAQVDAEELPALTTLSDSTIRFEVAKKPYAILRRGDVEAVIVDNQAVDDDVLPNHRAGYNGIASLKHAKRDENLFVPSYAGLNFEHIHDGTVQDRDILFEPRHAPMELRLIDRHTVELYQPPTPHFELESCTRYQILEDGTIEMTFECIPRRATFKNDFIGLFWASYIHQPESLDIHFKGHDDGADARSRWIRGVTPKHGVLSTHLGTDDERTFTHDDDFPLSLVFNRSKHRYTEPWYFGVSHDMALVLMFRPNDQVRLSQSPSGGGQGNSAWDFQCLFGDYEVGQRYQLVMRALYTPFESHEQIERITAQHRTALGPTVSGKPAWLPLDERHAGTSDHGGEQIIPEIAITKTPKPTADAAQFDREYVIELEKFSISNTGASPVATSRGLNQALQHAKSLGANRIVFPEGTYLVSETDPIVLDHTGTIIDLNGATLQINTNGLQKYSIVDIVDGAENMRLTNGNLRGDKDQHDYSTEKGVHAWGHGIIFHGGRNLEVDHLTISNVTGDGANSRFTGARTRPELLANIAHSIYARELEQGAFSADGRKVDSNEKTRSIAPYDLTKCNGEFEFGYSTGYLGYPFVQGRVYQAYFYDDEMKFIEMKKCLQFRKVAVPEGAKFAHLEFNQPEVSDEPLHAGAGRGSFVGRISNFKGPVDVHFHHNNLIGNRRLGLGYCGGRRWLIEENLFATNGGVAPSYGIDLEDGWEFMQDVVLRGNRFKDNVAGDLVICAGSELLIEGNVFEKNVAVHARPHNYTFRNNKFTGGHVGYKTRTGVASIHGNQYENCTLSIVFDTKAVADGINRKPGELVATPPLELTSETLVNVKSITGTYFNFAGATVTNSHFVAGKETSLIKFKNCDVLQSTIQYEAGGPPVKVGIDSHQESLKQEGLGLNRRRTLERNKQP